VFLALLFATIMAHFNGEFAHKIDQKGRVFVPRGFMDSIENAHERESFECVINSVDGCLEIYTTSEFAKYIEANLRNEKNALRAKKLRRSLGANSRKLKVDSQGRILLPEELRARISLSGEAMIVGALSYFEIWGRDTYESGLVDADDYFNSATGDMTSPDYHPQEDNS
jgi:MraZ protein